MFMHSNSDLIMLKLYVIKKLCLPIF